MILDPQKNASLWGSANQAVGSELLAASDGRIHVAWYRTHSEQFRAALVLIHRGSRFHGVDGHRFSKSHPSRPGRLRPGP